MVNYATTDGRVREFGNINIVSIKSGLATLVQDLITMSPGKDNESEKRRAILPVLLGETRESLHDRLNENSDKIINSHGQVVEIKFAV